MPAATSSDGTAALNGNSSGGALALEAAASRGRKVDRLAVYEIPSDSTKGQHHEVDANVLAPVLLSFFAERT